VDPGAGLTQGSNLWAGDALPACWTCTPGKFKKYIDAIKYCMQFRNISTYCTTLKIRYVHAVQELIFQQESHYLYCLLIHKCTASYIVVFSVANVCINNVHTQVDELSLACILTNALH